MSGLFDDESNRIYTYDAHSVRTPTLKRLRLNNSSYILSADPVYSEYDLGPDEFVPDQNEKPVDQSDKPMPEGGGNQGSPGNDYKEMPPHPPLYVPSMKNAEYFSPVYNRTQPGVTRTCRKAVDLYVLQPNRLNMSGSFNPLKGKLTNCHATGCERLV